MNGLSEPVDQGVKQQFNSSLRQPRISKIFQPKILLVILGIVLFILSIESILLMVMKNRDKSRKTENSKQVEVSEEKITPTPTIIKSSWEGKKTNLIKGKVSSFDINDQKIDLVLEDTTIKTIKINNKTVFLSIEPNEEQFFSPQSETIDISVFWEELKEGEIINVSSYDDGTAAFVTKISDYKNSD